MQVYLDSSVAVHAVLPDGDPRVRPWLDRVVQADEIVSSTLLRLELTRVCRRDGVDLSRAKAVLDRIREISINDGLLRDAGAIEPHVKSLDAIHLATCALVRPGVTLATHDRAMTQVAREIGLDVMDPLTAPLPGAAPRADPGPAVTLGAGHALTARLVPGTVALAQQLDEKSAVEGASCSTLARRALAAYLTARRAGWSKRRLT